MHKEWSEFADRLRHRTIRVLTVVSILLFDAAILGVGYVVIRLASLLSSSGNQFFEFAREASAAVFLLLYLVWVIYDLYDWMRNDRM